MIARWSHTSILLVSLLLLSAFAQTEKAIYNQIWSLPGEPYYHVPVGLCEDYPEETTTMEIIRKDFEFLRQHNIKFLRISFGWDAIESVKDNYDWLFWDDFVKMAVEEYSITLIPYVCYTPQWISTGGQDTLFFWDYPPKDYQQFGKFMGKIVTRYKKYIKTWELWNEPDIDIYWRGTVEEFSQLIKAGATAVKKADPDARVVLGGVAYDPHFIMQLFRDHGVSPYVDIVNMHNYYETWHRHPVESIKEYVNEIYDVVWRFGDGQTLWMAEVGYSTFRQGSTVSSVYSAYYDYEHSPTYQAVDLFKRLALVASTGKISAIAWYEIKDLPTAEEVIGDEYNNRHLGVAYTDHSPKPAARALSFFNELFSGKYRNCGGDVFVKRPLNSESKVLSFQKENGDAIVVAWLQTVTPGKRGKDRSGEVKDTRQENLDISINLPLGGKAYQFDELGNGQKYSEVQYEKEGVMLRDVKLSGGKITIIKLEKK